MDERTSATGRRSGGRPAHRGAAEIAVPTLVSTLAISCVFTSVVFLDGPAKYLFTPLPGYDGFVRADGQYVGESYPDFARNDPETFQRAYALLDLRAGVLHDAWEVNLFVSNVFDKQAALSQYISDNYSASTRARMFTNQPRTAGLSLGFKF